MIVTCNPHPEKSGVLIVSLDEDPVREVSSTIFGKKPSLPKEVDSMEALNEIMQIIELKGAKRYILNRLSQRSYHSIEMTNMLRKKHVSDDSIEKVIGDCERYGYVNDKEWLVHYVRSEREKKRGPQWIEGKLRQKGISLEDIRLALEETNDEEEMREQIFRLIRTRYRTRNLLDYREREKTIGAIIRRGYDVNMVREIIRICSQMH